jgi:hypothetical protein
LTCAGDGVRRSEEPEAERQKARCCEVTANSLTREPSGAQLASPPTHEGPLDPVLEEEAMQHFVKDGSAPASSSARKSRSRCNFWVAIAALLCFTTLGLCSLRLAAGAGGPVSLSASLEVAIDGSAKADLRLTCAGDGVRPSEEPEAERQKARCCEVTANSLTREPSGAQPILSAGVFV